MLALPELGRSHSTLLNPAPRARENAPDESEMDAHVPVDARAVETDVHAKRHAAPCRVLSCSKGSVSSEGSLSSSLTVRLGQRTDLCAAVVADLQDTQGCNDKHDVSSPSIPALIAPQSQPSSQPARPANARLWPASPHGASCSTRTLLAALAFVCLKNSSISCLVACADDMAGPLLLSAWWFVAAGDETRGKGRKHRGGTPCSVARPTQQVATATEALSLRAKRMRSRLRKMLTEAELQRDSYGFCL